MSDSSECGSPTITTQGCALCDPKKKYFNCICGKNWNTFEEHLNILTNLSHPLISKSVTVSTMTLCADFKSHVDLSILAEKYQDTIKYSPLSKKSKNNKSKKDCFYNSLLMTMTTKYQAKPSISVKFFPNGKIQIAGCNTIRACCYSLRKAFNRLLNNNCFMEEGYEISDAKIVMINTDFKINTLINQESLTQVLSTKTVDKNYNYPQVVYQSSKYPGINAKFIPDKKLEEYSKFFLIHGHAKKYPGIISMLIFRPGSIIITGGNEIEDYIEATTNILTILQENKNEVTYSC